MSLLPVEHAVDQCLISSLFVQKVHNMEQYSSFINMQRFSKLDKPQNKQRTSKKFLLRSESDKFHQSVHLAPWHAKR